MRSEAARRAVLLLLGSLMALALGEGLTRALAVRLFEMDSPTHRFDPQLGHVQKAGLTMVRRNEAQEKVRVIGSALGIREPPAPYGPGPKVLLVGDSFAAGTQLPFEATWAWLAQEELRRSQADLSVVNAAVDGYDLSQAYRMAERLWPVFTPHHLLVSVFIGNDLVDYEHEAAAAPPWRRWRPWVWLRERSYFLHFAEAGLRRLGRHKPASEPAHALRDWSPATVPGFAEFHGSRQRSLRNQFAATELLPVLRGGPEGERRLRATQRMLQSLAELARRNGAGVTIVLVPTKQQVVPAQREEWMRLHGLPAERALLPQAALGRWAREQGLSLVDATPALAASPHPETRYWVVNMHLSREGHRVVAEAVASALAVALDGRSAVAGAPARQAQRVRQQRDEGRKPVAHRRRAAGQVDDEAGADQAGAAAGEGRQRRLP